MSRVMSEKKTNKYFSNCEALWYNEVNTYTFSLNTKLGYTRCTRWPPSKYLQPPI